MLCTRWFLPLLILPVPTAPPYFLCLFLFSLTLHARPCFYCISLLTALFMSSCYWQPVPMNAPLSTPWDPSIRTFADALNATVTVPDWEEHKPSIIHMVDRCWVDWSHSGFFEPYNLTRWEEVSVRRVATEIEERVKEEKEALREKEEDPNWDLVDGTWVYTPPEEEEEKFSYPPHVNIIRFTDEDKPWQKVIRRKTTPPVTKVLGLWLWNSFRSVLPDRNAEAQPSAAEAIRPDSTRPADPLGLDFDDEDSPQSQYQTQPKRTRRPQKEGQPLIRSEYDLQPFGIDLIIDFGWSRRRAES